MNTLWHIFWTYIIFRKKKYYWKPLVFAFVPDATTLIIFALSLLANGTNGNSFHTIFTQQYEKFLIVPMFFHSLLVVMLASIIIWLTRLKSMWPFIYGWAFHIILDTATHASDNLPIFWPLSDYTFKSIFSYWELSHFATEVNIINMLLVSIAIIVMAKDSINKRFEAWFIMFVLFGSIASFLFLHAAHGMGSASFIVANIISICVMVYFLVMHKTVLTAKHL